MFTLLSISVGIQCLKRASWSNSSWVGTFRYIWWWKQVKYENVCL